MAQVVKKAALLVMDMQMAIVSRLTNSKTVIKNISEAIDIARNRNILIIYVVVGFRNNMPEISMNNKAFSATKERSKGVDMSQFMKIEDSLSPQADDIIVTKKRFSAFTGSDLDVILRANQIEHLILTGLSTSGVVLSTLREASDKDYQLTVLSDCCADEDEEVHQVLIKKIFSRQSDVITVDQWKSSEIYFN